jgi:hypothetical protein
VVRVVRRKEDSEGRKVVKEGMKECGEGSKKEGR